MKNAVAALLVDAFARFRRRSSPELSKRASTPLAEPAGLVVSGANAVKSGPGRQRTRGTKADARLRELAEGAEPGRCYTLQEIAAVMGITRERVRQIEMKALRTFRNRLHVLIKSEGVSPSELVSELVSGHEK